MTAAVRIQKLADHYPLVHLIGAWFVLACCCLALSYLIELFGYWPTTRYTPPFVGGLLMGFAAGVIYSFRHLHASFKKDKEFRQDYVTD